MFCTDLTMKNKIEMCFLPFIHTLSVLLSHQFSGLSSRSRHNSSESKMMWHQWNRLYVTNYLFLCQEKGNVLLKKFADVTGEKCNLSSCMTGKRDLLCCSNFIAITMQHNLPIRPRAFLLEFKNFQGSKCKNDMNSGIQISELWKCLEICRKIRKYNSKCFGILVTRPTSFVTHTFSVLVCMLIQEKE